MAWQFPAGQTSLGIENFSGVQTTTDQYSLDASLRLPLEPSDFADVFFAFVGCWGHARNCCGTLFMRIGSQVEEAPQQVNSRVLVALGFWASQGNSPQSKFKNIGFRTFFCGNHLFIKISLSFFSLFWWISLLDFKQAFPCLSGLLSCFPGSFVGLEGTKHAWSSWVN